MYSVHRKVQKPFKIFLHLLTGTKSDLDLR